MDRLRLVMPPLLFGVLQAPFTRLAHKVFPPAYANGIISGAFAFCPSRLSFLASFDLTCLSSPDVLYDIGHYALHHTKLPKYIKSMKVYHMACVPLSFPLLLVKHLTFAKQSSLCRLGPRLRRHVQVLGPGLWD